MISWLAANIGTILVLFVLLAIVSGILYTMRRDRKRGESSCGVRCGGGCSGCAGCAAHGGCSGCK